MMSTLLLAILAVMAVVNGVALLLVAYRFCASDRPAAVHCAVRPRIEDEPGWIAYAALVGAAPVSAPIATPATRPVRAPGPVD